MAAWQQTERRDHLGFDRGWGGGGTFRESRALKPGTQEGSLEEVWTLGRLWCMSTQRQRTWGFCG